MPEQKDVIIEVANLGKSLGGQIVLNGTNLKIYRGETLVIIGRSGCGKSVLLKHLIGLLRPDSGNIFVDGKDITMLNEDQMTILRRKFGMLFQGAALFDSLDVEENVSFGLHRYGDLTPDQEAAVVREKLALVGLPGVQRKKPAELSGGMRKRVGLARAIAMNPEIILYDEPTTGLDPIMADAINDLILDLQAKLHKTSVVVTHDMVSAYKIADRIAMLYEGKIIAEGSPEEIKSSQDPVVQQFINGKAVGPIDIMRG